MADAASAVDGFLADERADSNAWWRLDSGDHQVLFEMAVQERDDARAEVERLRAERDRLQRLVALALESGDMLGAFLHPLAERL